LSIFEGLLLTASLEQELIDGSDLGRTLFAPTDESITDILGVEQELIDGTSANILQLLEKPEFLLHVQNVLMYHITPGVVISSDEFSDGLVTEQASGEANRFAFNDTAQAFILSGFSEWNRLDAAIAVTDVAASNGVMHVLGTIPGTAEAGMLLPSLVFQLVAEPPASDVADYSTLVSLLEASGLTELLTTTFGPFMLLAPTNLAFEALPDGTVEALQMPENAETLQDLLSYHIGVKTDFNEYYIYPTNVVSNGLEIETLLTGKKVTVFIGDDGTVGFNDASSLEQILCLDGLIYGIDTVLTIPI
jgi:uncharacterized surface protein with fasciclin (FAS1) repeats